MDRYDELLKKAREEITVPPQTHDVVFGTVWEGLEKGLFDGMKRGYSQNRRPIGQPKRSLRTDAQKDQYRSLMDYTPPQPVRRPRAPQPEEPVDPVDAGLDAMRGPEGSPYTQGMPGSSSPYRNMPLPEEQPFVPEGPTGGPMDNYRPDGSRFDHQPGTRLTPPPLPNHPAPGYVGNTEGTPPSLTEMKPTGMRRKTLVPEGMEDQYPNFTPHQRAMEAGLSEMQDTPPSMRQASPEESARMTESGQEMGIVPYGHNFDQEIPRGTQLPPGKVPKQLPAPKTTDPVEAGLEEMKKPSKVGLPWSPTLTESGPGSRAEDWNTRNRSVWGKRSKAGKSMLEYYANLENQGKEDPGLDETPVVEKPKEEKKKGINMPQLVDDENKKKPIEGGSVGEAQERQKKREERREPSGVQQTLFGGNEDPKQEDKGLLEGLMTGEEKEEQFPKLISQSTDRDIVDSIWEAAKQGNESALSSLRNNQADAEVVLGLDDGDLSDLFKMAHWQNANLSLLPSGLLKQVQDQPRQADADYSLLPRGWQEGVAQ